MRDRISNVADQMPPSLAAELARQYDVIRMLGRGGMGTVWLGRERALERMVAIKSLSGDAIDTADARDRFRREARIAAKLVHPNIVPLYSFGETVDALYFVMGFVDGETLAARLDREGRLDAREARRIAADIADALAFAHHEGVVHRDVKPENILLDSKSGRAMLADFGIARAQHGATSATMTGIVVGTPSYMSPEQAVGDRAIDGRSDIYSLGVVGYRAIAGKLPFAGSSPRELLARQVTATPDDLSVGVAPRDRAIAHVFMRALMKDPAARWLRADDMRDELQNTERTQFDLPEELESTEMTGTRALFLVTATAAVAYLLRIAAGEGWVSGDIPPGVWWVLGILTLSLPVAGMFPAIAAARQFGWRETLRVAFYPLRGWKSWWPRAFRRPDDLWERLPEPLRKFRIAAACVFPFAAVTLLLFPHLLTRSGILWTGVHRGIVNIVMGAIVLGQFVPMVWGMFGFKGKMVKLGMNKKDFVELNTLPNSGSHPGWSKPKFARLLSSESPSVQTARQPRTPAELESAIAVLSKRLRNSGLINNDEIVDAARAVCAAIDALETDAQRLQRELDPAEREKLDRRLAALDASDGDLRALLEGQRAVWLRFEQRLLEKEARRARLHEQLVTLWMQLLELDARITNGAPADPEITGRVRALCNELAHAGEALTEAERAAG